MLEAIREKFTGWIAILIIGVNSLTLVFRFGNMDQTPLENDIVITVNSKEISLFDYREEFSNQLQRYQEVFGDQIPKILEESIKESTTDNLVLKNLLLDYIEQQGYRVSPQYVAELIKENSQFRLGDVFTKENYAAILASQGTTVPEFENNLRVQLEINQLRRAVIDTSFMTAGEFRRFVQLQMQERSGEYLEISNQQFIKDVAIQSENIESYYQENTDFFMTEEQIDVEYIAIDIDDIADSIVFNDEDLKEYYEDNIERFVSNEERRSRHILIATDEQVSEESALDLVTSIKNRLSEGEAFEVLAKEYSSDPGSAENGGDLGWAERGLFVPEFDETLFNLEINQISEPVKTQFGYHIIQLNELKIGIQQNFDEIENDLRFEYSRLLAEETLFDLASQMDDLSLQAFNELESVASKLDLTIQTQNSVTRNSSTLLNQDPELIELLFNPVSIEQTENTPVFEINNTILVARVAEHRLPMTKEYSLVKDQIISFLEAEQAKKLAEDYANRILQDFSEFSSFEKLAKDNSLEVIEFNSVIRSNTDIPSSLLEPIFQFSEQDIKNNRVVDIQDSENIYLIKLTQIIPGQLEKFSDEERTAGKQQMSEEIGSSELDAFAETLRENATVVIDDKLYNDLYDL
ncbi:MAG: peptidylprolyl isomerase [Gammaproteobacteria bacterium]|nr:peptidylprolyl isomerase [Gammaproteobacteria bacterium]